MRISGGTGVVPCKFVVKYIRRAECWSSYIRLEDTNSKNSKELLRPWSIWMHRFVKHKLG